MRVITRVLGNIIYKLNFVNSHALLLLAYRSAIAAKEIIWGIKVLLVHSIHYPTNIHTLFVISSRLEQSSTSHGKSSGNTNTKTDNSTE